MSKIHVYISIGDLENIFDNIPRISFDEVLFEENSVEFDYYRWFKKLMFGNSILHFDNEIEFDSSKSKYVHYLKKVAGTKEKLDFIMFQYVDDQEFIDEFPSNIIQVRDVSKLDHSKGYCLYEKSPINASVVRSLHNSVHWNIEYNKNEFEGWHKLREIKLPVNSLIIADGYCLRDEEVMINNTLKVVENCIPQEFDGSIPFHITFVIHTEGVPHTKHLEFLKRGIGKLGNVNIQIFHVSKKKLHDRFIMSNYWICTSGHSIDYFNKKELKGNKNTTLSYYGILSEGRKLYFDQQRRIKNIIEGATLVTKNSDFINRIVFK